MKNKTLLLIVILFIAVPFLLGLGEKMQDNEQIENQISVTVCGASDMITASQPIALNEPQYIDPYKPMIALTFDDGPSAYTDRLLDIFATYGGKGTFFVVGNAVDARQSTVKRIVDEGHEVGIHSWNHSELTKLNRQEIKNQITWTKTKIFNVSGYNSTIVRPPYGSWNSDVKSVGKELGVSFVNWSIDTLDWKSRNANAVYKEIVGKVRNGEIVLCHDLHETTVDAMEFVIPKLIEDGYQLVTVSQLLTYPDKKLEAGRMYYLGSRTMPEIPKNRAEVIIPDFPISVNGIVKDNTYAKYPYVYYKGITYCPMTYLESRFLGLETNWSQDDGLVISKNEDMVQEYGENQVQNVANSGKMAATIITDDKIVVNGKPIDNSREEYPILKFRDVVYLPLTWRFAVDEFGWQYSFSQQDGVSVFSQNVTQNQSSLAPHESICVSFLDRRHSIGV